MRWKFNKVLNYIASGLMGLIIGLYFYTAITVFIAGSTDNYGSAAMYLVMSILIIAYEVASEILIKKEKRFMVSWMPLVTITVLFVIMAGEYAMLGLSGGTTGTVNLALFLLSIIAILCEVVGYLMVLLSHFNVLKINPKVSVIVAKSLNTVACALMAIFGVLAILGAVTTGNPVGIALGCAYTLVGIFSCIAPWLVTFSKFGMTFNKNSIPTNPTTGDNVD